MSDVISELMSGASDRLKAAREKAGYETGADAARAMGIPVTTYLQHENGTRGFPASRAEKYGRFFRVTPEWLLYGKAGDTLTPLGPTLYVIGEVAAGVFKEAWRKEPEEWETFTGRRDIAAPLNDRFGLKVVGDSMDQLYPPGTILECCVYHGRDVIPAGKRVVVQRFRADDSVEATVKELVRDPDGIEWLVPRSNNPIHRAFRGDQPDDPAIVRVEIFGIVVGSYRPE